MSFWESKGITKNKDQKAPRELEKDPAAPSKQEEAALLS